MNAPVKRFPWWPAAWGFAVAVVASAVLMAAVDVPAAHYFRTVFDAGQRRFLGHVLGALGKPDFYFAACAAVYIVCWLMRRRAEQASERLTLMMHRALFVVFSIVAAGTVVNVAKIVVGRTRPRELFDHGIAEFRPFNTDFGMNTFPSGHAQMSWSLAIALFLIYPRLWPAYFLFASVLAASRFLASVHYLSDVVIGTYIGVIVPLLLKHYFYDARGIRLTADTP
ncbi:MAG: phosphatase PAP2 family protein [Rhodospirillaceae bacterium]